MQRRSRAGESSRLAALEIFGVRKDASFCFSSRKVSQAIVPSEPQTQGPGPRRTPPQDASCERAAALGLPESRGWAHRSHVAVAGHPPASPRGEGPWTTRAVRERQHLKHVLSDGVAAPPRGGKNRKGSPSQQRPAARPTGRVATCACSGVSAVRAHTGGQLCARSQEAPAPHMAVLGGPSRRIQTKPTSRLCLLTAENQGPSGETGAGHQPTRGQQQGRPGPRMEPRGRPVLPVPAPPSLCF